MDVLKKVQKLTGRFAELEERREEIAPQVRRALIEEDAAIRREQREILPELRRLEWQSQQREQQALQAEASQLEKRLDKVQGLTYQASTALFRARNKDDAGRAKNLAAGIEGHEAEQRETSARLLEVREDLRKFSVTDHFSGTFREFKQRLRDPLFFLDRRWADIIMAGAWREMRDDDEVFVRFRLEDGMALEDYTPCPPRR